MRVRSVEHLAQLAAEKKAVTGASSIYAWHHMPAQFVLNMPASRVLYYIKAGMMVCKKKPAKNKCK
jgi:hypothetical protein